MKRHPTSAAGLRRSLTNYKTLFSVSVMVVIGLSALASGTVTWAPNLSSLKLVVEQVGALLVATGALAILWELRGKRDLVDEVLAKVGVADDVKETGIFRASMDWRVVPWSELIANAREIDIHISYGSTWLSTHSAELKDFSLKRGKKLRYLLPDPEDAETMSVLASRFDYTPEIVQGKVREAARDVAELSRQGKADIRIWYRKGAPTFTGYRFDDTYVVTLYQHRTERTPVPTLMISGGSFGKFFSEDLDSIVQQGHEVPWSDVIEEMK
ncbi:hypothetical protein [Janibacter sp. GS2]|uniref:hypothetical protein n=1 Tax=Janibacter sp. GS2 TaxID=3442646 RepID=UPI003EBBDFAD